MDEIIQTEIDENAISIVDLGKGVRSYEMPSTDAVPSQDLTVELSFSSETPIEMMINDKMQYEVLDSATMDLSRLNDGAPVLWNHKEDDQRGVVEKAWIGEDRKGRAIIRFSKTHKGQEIFTDVSDGIKRMVSVGYRRVSARKAKVDNRDVILTTCQPYEISIVSIPADVNVGVGRSVEQTQNNNKVNIINNNMNENKTETVSVSDEQTLNATRKVETAVTTTPKIEVVRESFSISDEINKALQGKRDLNITVPRGGKRTMTAGSNADGGFTIDFEVRGGDVIAKAYEMSAAVKAGARVISTTSKANIVLPRQLTGAVAEWVTENGAPSSSGATFDQVILTPKRISVVVPVSKQLLMQTELADGFIMEDIARALAVLKDQTYFAGTGVSPVPLGILNTAGISTVATTVSAPTYLELLGFQTALSQAFLSNDPAKFIASSAAYAKLASIKKDNGSGLFLAQDGKLNGKDLIVTENLGTDKLLYGDFNSGVIADFSGVEVIVDNLTLAANGLIRLIVNQYCDFAVTRPKSFAVSTNSIV